MKKKLFLACLLLIVFSLLLAGSAYATPAAVAESTSHNELADDCCILEEDVLVPLTYREYFTANTFSQSYQVNHSHEIQNVSLTGEGISIISYTVYADTLTVTVEMSETVSDASAVIQVHFTDDTQQATALYTTRQNGIVYKSVFFMDDAYECYYNHAKSLGMLTQQQIEAQRQLRHNLIAQGNASTQPTISPSAFSAPATTDNGTAYAGVSGTLTWVDDIDDNTSHPLMGVKVEIYANGTLCGTVYTNTSGVFSYLFGTTGNKANVYIRIYAGDGNISVCYPVGTGDAETIGDFYSDTSDTVSLISAGTTTNISASYTMSDALGQAMQISQAAIIARNFAEEMYTASSISPVTILYPSTEKNCCYYPATDVIKIIADDRISRWIYPYSSWDVIMHEYGHHVSFELGFVQTGALGESKHSSSDIHAAKRGKVNGNYFAWREAWPTVFGMVAQDYYQDILSGVDYINNESYDSYNFTYPRSVEFEYALLGESCEGTIISFLWDLFDAYSDGEYFDNISLSHQEFWSLTTDTSCKTFSVLVNRCYQDSLIDNWAIYELLEAHNLTALELFATASDLIAPTTYSWQRGGYGEYYYNFYVIKFYDENGTLLFEREITPPSLSIGEDDKKKLITDIISYTLSPADYSYLVSHAGERYRWAVFAYQNDSTSNTGAYVAYRSDKIFESAPISESAVPKQTFINNLPNYRFYKFIAPAIGEYEFLSTGNYDTLGELLSGPVYGTSNQGLLISADGGGEGDNFRFTYILAEGQIVYLRVTVLDYVAPSRYFLDINFFAPAHIYTDHYTPGVGSDSETHRAYCVCGEYITQGHTYVDDGIRHIKCSLCGYRRLRPTDGSIPGIMGGNGTMPATVPLHGDDEE